MDEAIRAAKAGCPDRVAQMYLVAIPDAFERADQYDESAVKALRVQLLYALNNMRSWRGPVAREAKAVLRAYCKED